MKLPLSIKYRSLLNKVKRLFNRSKQPPRNTTSKSNSRHRFENNTFLRFVSNKKVIQITAILFGLFFMYGVIESTVHFLSISLDKDEFDSFEVEEWDGYERFNIAMIGLDKKPNGYVFVDRIIVIHLNPENSRLGIFSINTKFEITLLNGTKNTLKLAYNEGLIDRLALQNVMRGIENLIGITIPKYIVVDTNQVKNILGFIPQVIIDVDEDINDVDFPPISKGAHRFGEQELYNYLASEVGGEDIKSEKIVHFFKSEVLELGNPLNIFLLRGLFDEFLNNVSTNLTQIELLRIFWFARGLRDDQIRVAYTKEDTAIKDEVFQNVWQPIYQSIDRDLKIIFENQSVKFEQAKIEVKNATDVKGLASKRGRLIENLGCRVIHISNTTIITDKNLIYVANPENYPETIKEILSTFRNEVIIIREDFPNRHIGDIVVVIGNEID